MLKKDVEIGAYYKVRLNGKFTVVRITRTTGTGGWFAINTASNRIIRIKSAAKLRGKVGAPNTPQWNTMEQV